MRNYISIIKIETFGDEKKHKISTVETFSFLEAKMWLNSYKDNYKNRPNIKVSGVIIDLDDN